VKVFERYAEYYDLLYQDKNYEEECDFLEEIFRAYCSKPITNILELGCGTGGHAIPLAKRGYRLTGLDCSPAMLKQAEKKSKGIGINLTLHQADIKRYDLGCRFDAAIAMFAVLNYMTTNEDLRVTFSTVRKHLNKDSLFIFDVWNGLAVMHLLPSARIKTVEDSDMKVIRLVEPEIRAEKHLCLSHYKLLVVRKGILSDEIEETHRIRYLFPLEIAHYLEDADFQLLQICPFLNLKGQIDENQWNMAVIAKAIEKEGKRNDSGM